MTDTPKPKMSPKEGQDAIFDLVTNFVQPDGPPGLDKVDDILEQLGQIVSATGIEVPGFDAQNSAIREGSANAQRHSENTAAALWTGDLQRFDELIQSGPEMDLEAMGVPVGSLDEDGDEVDDLEFDAVIDLHQMPDETDLADLNFDAPEPDGTDIYADIAEGKPGALAAFLKSGLDPNLTSGASRHTALLAALDAPGRRVEHIWALVDAGADATAIHDEGDNALSWAMGYHHPDTVTRESEIQLMAYLVSSGADPNHVANGFWIVLHRAIVQGGANQVAAILAAGADVAPHVFADFHPEKLAHATPVMLAAPKPEVLRSLLDHGANAEEHDSLGRAPINFVENESIAARARSRDDDPWTIAHAEALETSLQILRDHLGL